MIQRSLVTSMTWGAISVMNVGRVLGWIVGGEPIYYVNNDPWSALVGCAGVGILYLISRHTGTGSIYLRLRRPWSFILTIATLSVFFTGGWLAGLIWAAVCASLAWDRWPGGSGRWKRFRKGAKRLLAKLLDKVRQLAPKPAPRPIPVGV